MKIAAGILEPDKMYTYTVRASKNSRETVKYTTITTTFAPIPTVSIIQDFELVNRADKVNLSTIVQSTGPTTIKWEQISNGAV